MTHLTEEQIDELLMGSLEPAEAAQMREHATECEACATQLAELEAPIASFNAVTLAWSERRSATLPVRPSPKRAGARFGTAFAWGSLAAAALLAAVIPVLRHEQDVHVREAYSNAAKVQSTPQTATTASAAQPANAITAQNDSAATNVPEKAQEIAKDNQLLAMVDEELNAPMPAPGARTQSRGHIRTNTSSSVQD